MAGEEVPWKEGEGEGGKSKSYRADGRGRESETLGNYIGE